MCMTIQLLSKCIILYIIYKLITVLDNHMIQDHYNNKLHCYNIELINHIQDNQKIIK